MQLVLVAVLAFFVAGCATVQSRNPAVSILLDLDLAAPTAP